MSEPLTVKSHAGPYSVLFESRPIQELGREVPADARVVIDSRIASLYADELAELLARPSTLRVEALEQNKSLERMPGYVEQMVAHGVRRGMPLVAIGGGIIQDITCFLAAILLRGLQWHFYPTTLLAQADSCIGSKSSINVGRAKNIVGTFTPPRRVVISTRFLDTLAEVDLRSGIGEMLKVHAIESPSSFQEIAGDYPHLLEDRDLLEHYIGRSLEIKRRIIERDEFDVGLRNVMNYGHSFGHAIESATDFGVPHGIAVTMGMDAANFVSWRLGHGAAEHFERMHPTLRRNYGGYEDTAVPLQPMLEALSRDKKNTGTSLRLILPDREGRVAPGEYPNDDRIRGIVAEFLTEVRRSG